MKRRAQHCRLRQWIFWAGLLLFATLSVAGCGGTGGEDDSEVKPAEQDTTAPSQITDLEAISLSTASVQLTWTSPGDDGPDGTVDHYDIRYATHPIDDDNWDSATQASDEPLPVRAGGAASFPVTGLTAATLYYFCIKAVDEASNEGSPSNVASAPTAASPTGDATIPGNISCPYPTQEHLSIEWEIEGDNNLDGSVSVRYRAAGERTWRSGMNLFRIPADSNEGFLWSDKYSGSLFELMPDTPYEIELTLQGPDNTPFVQTVNAHTRAIPQAAVNAVTTAVGPDSLSAALLSADPGEILLLETGTYNGFTVSRNGETDNPMVIRGTDADSVVINGDVRLDGCRHVHLESVTVNGMIKFNNGIGIVVRGCCVHADEHGIVTIGSSGEYAYIVDNTVIGATTWADSTVGANGQNIGEGILVTGPGHVIAHNYVRGFRDAISLMEDNGAYNQVSIDICHNDIEVGADDGIEADFAMGNVRVLNNRITNSFVGLSSQPSLGGPTYFIRNAMYNIIYSPFKIHRGSIGDIALHNTSVKCGDAFAVFTSDTWSRAYFRNNLFIGGEGGGSYGGYGNGNGAVANLYAADAGCSFNHDGYGSIGTDRFEGRIGVERFDNLGGMRDRTSEIDAQQVDLNIFDDAIAFPATPFPEKAIPELLLRSGTDAIDTGLVISNINDNYTGTAPDLGAYELGDSLPHYGPR